MRPVHAGLALVGSIGFCAIGLEACSGFSEDCENTNTCDSPSEPTGGAASVPPVSSGTGGTGGALSVTGGTGTGGVDPSCSASLTPSDDACVITEAYGVFVSPLGSDSGSGTRWSPLKTINHALAFAKSVGKKRIYACADGGSFAESVLAGADYEGFELYGGFTCSDFAYKADTPSRIFSSQGTALTIVDMAAGFRVEDFDIESTDALLPGASSTGVLISNAASVVLRRISVLAGDGAPGIVGSDGEEGAAGDAEGATPAGLPGTCSSSAGTAGGSWPMASSCGSRGGDGGNGASGSGSGTDGLPGQPTQNVDSPGYDNGGSGSSGSSSGDAGLPGSDGIPGDPGAMAPTVGELTAEGFAPANGGNGTPGFPGQGGGGGGGGGSESSSCSGASGGSGGMGGCGGQGGRGGGGGGASIAILVWQSTVTLDQVTLTAGNGGPGAAGGQGGWGGNGGPGGVGGTSSSSQVSAGGLGGRGGTGGPGGSGSGGSGGPSFALAYAGTEPNITGTFVTAIGEGGAAGLGGAARTGALRAVDGRAGIAEEVYSVE